MPNNKCSRCGNEKEIKGSYCRKCNKQYKKENKIKIMIQARDYYKRNKEAINKRNRNNWKENKYKKDETSTREKTYKKLIRQRTREKYPITNQICAFCNKKAVEHHHYTKPMEEDKFDYVCKDCHTEKELNLKIAYLKGQLGV